MFDKDNFIENGTDFESKNDSSKTKVVDYNEVALKLMVEIEKHRRILTPNQLLKIKEELIEREVYEACAYIDMIIDEVSGL